MKKIIGRDRVDEMEEKIHTIKILRYAKNHFTYRELAEAFSTFVTVVFRYNKGELFPKIQKCRQMVKILSKRLGLNSIIYSYVNTTPTLQIDSEIINDPLILNYFKLFFVENFAGRLVNYVVGPEYRGAVLARDIGMTWDVPFVPIEKLEYRMGRRDKKSEEEIICGGDEIKVCVGKGVGEKMEGKDVVVIDDSIRTGATMKSVISFLKEKINVGNITGIQTIIKTKSGEEEVRKLYPEIEIYSLSTLSL